MRGDLGARGECYLWVEVRAMVAGQDEQGKANEYLLFLLRIVTNCFGRGGPWVFKARELRLDG